MIHIYIYIIQSIYVYDTSRCTVDGCEILHQLVKWFIPLQSY